MGEDDVAWSGAVDSRSVGGRVWVRSEEGRGVEGP